MANGLLALVDLIASSEAASTVMSAFWLLS
jgi:hypothetical protein